jgi:hypothetical protein
MTATACGAEAILRVGGPVQVPLQPCCIGALLRARTPVPWPAACPLRALTAASSLVATARRTAA